MASSTAGITLATRAPLPVLALPAPLPSPSTQISYLKLSVIRLLTAPHPDANPRDMTLTPAQEVRLHALHGWRTQMLRLRLVQADVEDASDHDAFVLRDDHDCSLLEPGDVVAIDIVPPFTLSDLKLPERPKGHVYHAAPPPPPPPAPATRSTAKQSRSAQRQRDQLGINYVLQPASEPSSHSSSIAANPSANYHQYNYRRTQTKPRVVSQPSPAAGPLTAAALAATTQPQAPLQMPSQTLVAPLPTLGTHRKTRLAQHAQAQAQTQAQTQTRNRPLPGMSASGEAGYMARSAALSAAARRSAPGHIASLATPSTSAAWTPPAMAAVPTAPLPMQAPRPAVPPAPATSAPQLTTKAPAPQPLDLPPPAPTARGQSTRPAKEPTGPSTGESAPHKQKRPSLGRVHPVLNLGPPASANGTPPAAAEPAPPGPEPDTVRTLEPAEPARIPRGLSALTTPLGGPRRPALGRATSSGYSVPEALALDSSRSRSHSSTSRSNSRSAVGVNAGPGPGPGASNASGSKPKWNSLLITLSSTNLMGQSTRSAHAPTASGSVSVSRVESPGESEGQDAAPSQSKHLHWGARLTRRSLSQGAVPIPSHMREETLASMPEETEPAKDSLEAPDLKLGASQAPPPVTSKSSKGKNPLSRLTSPLPGLRPAMRRANSKSAAAPAMTEDAPEVIPTPIYEQNARANHLFDSPPPLADTGPPSAAAEDGVQAVQGQEQGQEQKTLAADPSLPPDTRTGSAGDSYADAQDVSQLIPGGYVDAGSSSVLTPVTAFTPQEFSQEEGAVPTSASTAPTGVEANPDPEPEGESDDSTTKHGSPGADPVAQAGISPSPISSPAADVEEAELGRKLTFRRRKSRRDKDVTPRYAALQRDLLRERARQAEADQARLDSGAGAGASGASSHAAGSAAGAVTAEPDSAREVPPRITHSGSGSGSGPTSGSTKKRGLDLLRRKSTRRTASGNASPLTPASHSASATAAAPTNHTGGKHRRNVSQPVPAPASSSGSSVASGPTHVHVNPSRQPLLSTVAGAANPGFDQEQRRAFIRAQWSTWDDARRSSRT